MTNTTPAVAPLSAEQLDNLEELLNAATPGDWTHKRHGVIVAGPFRQYTNGSAQSQIAAFNVTFHEQAPDDEPERQIANAEFAVAAKNSMAALIAQARAAEQAGAAAPSYEYQPRHENGMLLGWAPLAHAENDDEARAYCEPRGLEWRRATPQSQVATYTAGIDVLNAEELAALRRFDECAQDGEGYDVPKAMMRRLSEIGVVQRLSGAYYHVTEYGMRVLGNAPVATAAPARDAEDAQTQAARDVLAERRRQIEREGWTPGLDDSYKNLELNRAAVCYLSFGQDRVPSTWPWSGEWWKPTNYRRNLVKAGALILAEIERLDRAATAGQKGAA